MLTGVEADLGVVVFYVWAWGWVEVVYWVVSGVFGFLGGGVEVADRG